MTAEMLQGNMPEMAHPDSSNKEPKLL